MSSKRRADKYLTDQNWDQEEEEEEKGEFEAASVDVLKQRTFKKAKRRIVQTGESTSAFKGFAGLTASKVGTDSNGFKGFALNNSSSTFGFPQKEADVPAEKPTYTEKPVEKAQAISPIRIQKVTPLKANQTECDTVTEGDKKSSDSDAISFSEFNRHLSALNRSVSKWISEHVAKDPICDLTPIFNDYQKHYTDIEDKYGSANSSQSDPSSQSEDQEEKPTSSIDFTKPDIIIPATASRPKTPPKDPLGITSVSSTAAPSPFKGFGLVSQDKPSTSSSFSGFQFGSKMVQGATSSTAPVQSGVQQTTSTEEEEYVPPKPESNIVEEKDAFYSKKCKLFYMKDNSYADRGVGHLHLKTVSNKTQLIVRADTSLGNVLLNIVVNSTIPTSRQGKNNVMISCVPNPPIDPKNADKVTPMLIRVKTTEDADELLEILNKKKQECE